MKLYMETTHNGFVAGRRCPHEAYMISTGNFLTGEMPTTGFGMENDAHIYHIGSLACQQCPHNEMTDFDTDAVECTRNLKKETE